MNETKKTGIFWGVAAVTALIAAVVAWPTSSSDDGGSLDSYVGQPLFAEFKDPLTAASLKIVVFDEELGELRNFEVRKDQETGLWTIPSKGGYPADAIEQMRDAANALVDLKGLDAPTDNAEDHTGMGVVEPKLEDLDVGDEGVGRLVTFKDESQNVLASLIIGDPVKEQEGQLYVRKPGQDLVYTVELDDSPLTTEFEDWIEEDLLQLSSIDVENVEVKDYTTTLGLQSVDLKRNYSASLTKDGSQWKLASLKEYDQANPLDTGTEVSVEPDEKLNSQKLNDLSNALDDLKFVDVARKPDGISANLRADKDFAEDRDAKAQLATRGFIPVQMGAGGELEILSANGELTATTREGVKYILRFGNISGISTGKDEEAEGEDAAENTGGVNRYLMVSTVVDESKFPAPELKPIPQTLEDLDKLDKPEPPAGVELPAELNAPEQGEPEAGETADSEPAMKEGDEAESNDESEAEPKDSGDDAGKDAGDGETGEEADDTTSETKGEEAAEGNGEAESGETNVSGEGDSGGVGEGQDQEGETDEDAGEAEEGSGEKAEETEETASEDTSGAAEMKKGEAEESEAVETEAGEEIEETEEEKLERLAAVQEKITKENERKLEERKDKMEQAERRSRELNARFADWYYVIPEDTYTKLRISRDDLFDNSGGAANPAAAGPSIPGLGMPPGGLPPGFGN